MKHGDKAQGICKTHGLTEGTYKQMYCSAPQGRLIVLMCDECNVILEVPNQSVEHHTGWKKWNLSEVNN